VLTSFRREQRAEELIANLKQVVAACSEDWQLVVASHFHKPLHSIAGHGTELWPLTNDEDYWSALVGFDVAVFYYDRGAYEYRTSGIVADAIACGVPVICPNFPVLVRQVNWPAPLGLVYETLSELPVLLAQIADWPVGAIERARFLHHRYRGQDAYAGLLEAIRAGADGNLCKTNSTSENQ
jgi:glycosyltransferase involved in cell wall biosynthesis